MGNSAQDGVNMARANAGEGINYGQYLQVIREVTLYLQLHCLFFVSNEYFWQIIALVSRENWFN